MDEKNFKDVFLDFISKNIGAITLFIISLFFITSYFSNQYELIPKTYEICKNNRVVEKTVWLFSSREQTLSIINAFLLNLSVALIITFFILRYLERKEKESFYNKLEEFQKNTAKDAIKSVFERIIEPKFFHIIEQDVLNARFIRYNAKWDYDFSINNSGKIELKRTIIYTLKNITHNKEIEKFKIISENSIHAEIVDFEFKYKRQGENEYRNIEMQQENENHKIVAYEDIQIDAHKEIQVIISWKEIFKCDYVYATHFIRFPILGLELNVNFPEEYEFEIIIDTFSTKLKKIYGPYDGKIKYKTEGGLYKGQGIEFILYKKNHEII